MYIFIARLKRFYKRTNLQRSTWMEGQSNEYNPKWHNSYNWYLAQDLFKCLLLHTGILCVLWLYFKQRWSHFESGPKKQDRLMPNSDFLQAIFPLSIDHTSHLDLLLQTASPNFPVGLWYCFYVHILDVSVINNLHIILNLSSI